MKKWLGFLLGLLVSVGILYMLIGSDLDAVKNELENARYGYAVVFVLLHTLGTVTRSLRWHVLLNRKISYRHSFQIISVGYFLSSLLPLRLGDLTRAWMTKRLDPPISGSTSLSTIIVERLMDLLAVVGLLGITLFFLEVPAEVSSLGIIMGVLAVLGLFSLGLIAAHPALIFSLLRFILKRLPLLNRLEPERRLHSFLSGIQAIGTPQIALQAIFWTVVSWAISVGGGYVILFTLFSNPPLSAALALTLLTALSVALPAVPGNLGPFEGATVGAVWLAGLIPAVTAPENAAGVALGTLLHVLSLGTYVILGIYGLIAEQTSIRQIAQGTKAFIEGEETASLSESDAENLAENKHPKFDIVHESIP